MKRWCICCKMMVKRMGRVPVYWLLLALFPLTMLFSAKLNEEASDGKIAVGYVYEKQKDAAEQDEYMSGLLERKLSEQEEKQLLFYEKCETEEELDKRIATGELACGVVFGEKFSEKLSAQDYYHCIEMHIPEGMNLGGMVQEDVFQRVYQAYSAIWYADMLKKQGYSVEGEKVLEKFAEYRKEGKVFAVKYREPGAIQDVEKSILSLRGILAFLTLLAAILGALEISRDKGRGIGSGISCPGRLAAAIAGVPVFIAVIFLAAGMILSGGLDGMAGITVFGTILREIGMAFLYGMVLWGASMLAGKIFSERILACLAFCYIFLTIICCPVFFDLGELIPAIGYLSKLFPITWYLKLTNIP